MNRHQFLATVEGADLFAIAGHIAAWREFRAEPSSVSIDNGYPLIENPGPTWLRHARSAKRSAHASWPPEDAPLHEQLWLAVDMRPPSVTFSLPGFVTDERDILARLLPLPFTVAVAGLPDSRPISEAYKRLYSRRPHSTFHSGHQATGFGCLFRGAGHDLLVSRRWLDHGPWYTEYLPDDTTYVQVCDPTADPETIVAQAIPAQERLGYSDTGGVFQVGAHELENPVNGLYVREDGSFRIVCAEGRVVSPREMLDACGVKKLRRDDPAAPIAAVRFVFAAPADARAHLHELWLRELECWTFDERTGAEIRLDLDYRPPPETKPDWVAGVAARRAAERRAGG